MPEINPIHTASQEDIWPSLPWETWQDTCNTLHLWTQIVGKIRLELYNTDWGEFILPYEVVRTAPSPDDKLLAFLESTYEAAANLSNWDRVALERTLD